MNVHYKKFIFILHRHYLFFFNFLFSGHEPQCFFRRLLNMSMFLTKFPKTSPGPFINKGSPSLPSSHSAFG